ncbi:MULTISPECIES: hypothetical protein [Nitrosomonas]|uniref:Uncharacterized protein n=1 Tax=Nitrosomonas communis TaxID=44574 RepID=A0A0F7KIV0_9PROT|nr:MULTISPECIES: hypothetical protein [Nitrosomonas]AKH38782.1 hypothetical protein AAW31_14795 [Nitrosomonas communis]TYP71587.1 hypothetical protein BCL69_11102 [Nitrosomonas communis]UVS60887.1 hypothetical protein NX761_15530 [Nitrosomonas sp. PLL12]
MTTINTPAVKWAVYPGDEGKVSYIEELWDSPCTLPSEGSLIIRPFLIDPETRQPVPVRVAEIRDHSEMQPHTLVFVVTPADLNH